MKGDFSKLGPWPDDAVTGVWLQQGRPLLDADWNQSQVALRRAITSAVDTLLGGPAGAAGDCGFQVTALAGLSLNSGQSGQALCFTASHSLPFGHAEDADEPDGGEQDAQPHWDIFQGGRFAMDDAGRAYLIELELEVPAGAVGVIMEQPGHVGVRLRSDGSLLLGPGEVGGVTASGIGPQGGAFRLALARFGHLYVLYLDGKAVGEWRGDYPSSESGGAVFSIGGASGGTESLTCRLDLVRVWRRRRRGHGHLKLAADLDMGRLHGQTVPDRSRHHNDAKVTGPAAQAPVVQLRVGAGRYVVGGAPIHNAATRPLRWPADMGQTSTALVYLDVTERTVSALEDPRLREVALGGPDTVVQTRSVWRIGLVLRDREEAAFHAFRHLTRQSQGRLQFDHSSTPADNTLYRVEVQDAGWSYTWPLGSRAREAAYAVTAAGPTALTWPSEAPTPALGAPVLAFAEGGAPWLLRVTAATPGQVSVKGGPQQWPQGTINVLPLASFKWSADNAAPAFNVEGVLPVQDPALGAIGRVQLASPGFNGLDLRANDWVELTGIEEDANSIGRLYPIANFDRGLLQVDLANWDGGPPRRSGLILRRWGPSPAAGAGDNGFPSTIGAGLIRLDEGGDVAVRFESDAYYAAGDWWTLPLRQSAEDAGSSGRRVGAWEPPQGPPRHYAPLALVRFGDRLHVRDLRRTFVDLATLSQGGGVEPGPSPSPYPPDPDRHEPTAREAAHWLHRHMPQVRLLAPEGEAPHGFAQSGETLSVSCIAAARWKHVDDDGPRPGGPGQAVYVSGGVVFVEEGTRGAWRWTSTEGWARLHDRPSARRGFAAVAFGSAVVLLGGSLDGRDELSDTIEIMLGDGEWETVGCDCTPAFRPAAAVVGSVLHVTGGVDRNGKHMRRCQAIDLRTGEAAELRPMRIGRSDHAMVAIDGTAWVFGGIDGERRTLADVEAYEAPLNRWRVAAPLGKPVSALAAVATEDGVVVAGGRRDHHHSDAVALYSPGGDGWSPLAALPAPRRRFGLAAQPNGPLGSGRLLAIGGAGEREDFDDRMLRLRTHRRLALLTPREND